MQYSKILFGLNFEDREEKLGKTYYFKSVFTLEKSLFLTNNVRQNGKIYRINKCLIKHEEKYKGLRHNSQNFILGYSGRCYCSRQCVMVRRC